MNPTIVVLRIDGHGTEHLSLHTKRRQAFARLDSVGRLAWHGRFDYGLPLDLDAEHVSDRLVREGWRVRVSEEVVEL